MDQAEGCPLSMRIENAMMQLISLQPVLFKAGALDRIEQGARIRERRRLNGACLWHDQCLDM
jgi:hypothetical protein